MRANGQAGSRPIHGPVVVMAKPRGGGRRRLATSGDSLGIWVVAVLPWRLIVLPFDHLGHGRALVRCKRRGYEVHWHVGRRQQPRHALARHRFSPALSLVLDAAAHEASGGKDQKQAADNAANDFCDPNDILRFVVRRPWRWRWCRGWRR